MDIKNSIRKLRIFALLLFIAPSIGLLGSLIIHNYLVSFKFTYELNYNFKENIPGDSVKFLCNEENNYCLEETFDRFKTPYTDPKVILYILFRNGCPIL